MYKTLTEESGIRYVFSGPLVRSSYLAEHVFDDVAILFIVVEMLLLSDWFDLTMALLLGAIPRFCDYFSIQVSVNSVGSGNLVRRECVSLSFEIIVSLAVCGCTKALLFGYMITHLRHLIFSRWFCTASKFLGSLFF